MQVSVIIPAYNHEKYIGAAISSVLGQSLEDLELIVINDGSTDCTENAVLGFSDQRLIYIAQQNQGAHNAINKGIDTAKGDYITILNSDDVYKRNRLEKCLKFLENNKEYSVVITEVEGIDSEDIIVTKSTSPQIEAWLNWYQEALVFSEKTDFLLCAFAKNLSITTSNYFMRKEVFRKAGKFRRLRYAHDWDMLLRLSQCCKVHLLRNSLLRYRIHDSNTIREDNCEAKIRFEVNWLIADNIRHLRHNVSIGELFYCLEKNHYIRLEVLSLLLMINDAGQFESLLDFSNPTTLQIMELLE